MKISKSIILLFIFVFLPHVFGITEAIIFVDHHFNKVYVYLKKNSVVSAILTSEEKKNRRPRHARHVFIHFGIVLNVNMCRCAYLSYFNFWVRTFLVLCAVKH